MGLEIQNCSFLEREEKGLEREEEMTRSGEVAVEMEVEAEAYSLWNMLLRV